MPRRFALATPRTASCLTLSAAALLALAGHARAQTALGDGRALDRNPQVGSGGYNPAAPSINDQIRLNNAIITGNAPGARSFRGYVGYGAPSDFRATVPSDTLYSFRRDSAISGAFGAGVRGTDALRYQFALSTGQALPQSIAQSYASIPRAGSTTSASAASALRSTSEFLASQSARPTLVGARVDDQGYEWSVKASPLLGINWARSDRPIRRIERPEDAVSKFDLGASQSGRELEPLSTRGRVPGLSGIESVAPGIESVLDREPPSSPLLAPSTRVMPQSSEVHAQVLHQLQSAFDSSKPPATDSSAAKPAQPPVDASLEAQMERLRARLRGQPEKPKPAQPSIYEPILNRLNSPDRKPGEAPSIPNTPEAPKPDAKSPAGDKPADASTPPATPPPYDPRQPVKPGEFRQVPKVNDPEPRDPDTGKRIVKDLPSSTSPLSPEMVKGIQSVGQMKIDMLTRPRVVVEGQGRAELNVYESHMVAGQDALTAAKFFEAEDRFTRAVAAMPGDPLAQVGRAHAQLSAGLYISAAANLRRLFSDHPEMIGATYGSNLVPTGQRADRIAEQLRADMTKEIPALGRDAAMLLAYLGHIRSDPTFTREGLAEMAKRFDPNNPADAAFLDLSRAAWAK